MSGEQSMRALEAANQSRRRTAWLRRNVRAGTVSVTTAIGDPACERRLVIEVLRFQKHWGPARADQAVHTLGISPRARCGELTGRQRELLSKWLDADLAERREIVAAEQQLWHPENREQAA